MLFEIGLNNLLSELLLIIYQQQAKRKYITREKVLLFDGFLYNLRQMFVCFSCFFVFNKYCCISLLVMLLATITQLVKPRKFFQNHWGTPFCPVCLYLIKMEAINFVLVDEFFKRHNSKHYVEKLHKLQTLAIRKEQFVDSNLYIRRSLGLHFQMINTSHKYFSYTCLSTHPQVRVRVVGFNDSRHLYF